MYKYLFLHYLVIASCLYDDANDYFFAYNDVCHIEIFLRAVFYLSFRLQNSIL